jgi:geranylgeranyl reductase family protein
MKKIIIVGGGPAGSFCAYNLAKNGIYPTIFDDSHPREKPCGGGVSPLAQEKFSFLRKIPIPRGGGNKIEIISPKNKKIIIKGKKKCIVFSRTHLDSYILKMAMKEGSKLVKERVLDIKKSNKKWIIKSKDKKIIADIIIGADGANSLVRRKIIGPLKKEDLSLAFGYFVKGIENRPAIIKFLKNKKGYIWAFQRDDHTSLGIGTEFYEAKEIKNELDSFIKEYFPHIKIISEWAALIPMIKNLKTYEIPVAGDNWILIGDAAGHVDPVIGEGIPYALWSGELAAKAIIEGNPKKFDEMWRKEYGAKLIEGSKLRDMFYNKYLLEFFIRIAPRSKTCSEFLYDILTGSEMYNEILFKFIKKSPKILLECFNII